MLDKLWDDVLAGPQPEQGLSKLRNKLKPISLEGDSSSGSSGSDKFRRSISMPTTAGTPGTPVTPTTPSSARKENVWRSVFNPGSNIATKGKVAHQMFDKPQPNSPTVYDWLYSGETRSKHV